ncbi:MAG: VPLPA-CTERM-specific exosortase XrtD [Pseudomonadota bacterium]
MTAEQSQSPLTTWLTTPRALALIGATLISLFVFRDAIANLFERWGTQDELSHSYFIPVISGWLIWSNKDAIMASAGRGGVAAVGLGFLAGFMLLAGQLTHAFILQQLGFVVAIAALVAGYGGRSMLAICAVPVLYLLFAVPPPFWLITNLSWNFQRMSSELGVAMIQAMNIPVYLSGNVIDLGTYQLAVAEACSGLRYLFPFLSLGFLAAYLFKGTWWQKAIIFLSTIPITILMNSLRIAITGILVQAYGTSHTEGFLHFFEGWVVFLLCLAALFGVISLFCVVLPPRTNPLDEMGVPALSPRQPTTGGLPLAAMPEQFRGGAALITIAALFVVTAGLAKIVTVDKLITPERQVFAAFPGEFRGWRAEIQPIDSEVAEVLGADDSLVVNMTSPEGELYNVYMAYLTARRDGRSWHSPRQCIPGGGWQVTDFSVVAADEAAIPADERLPFAYNRMVIEYNGTKRVIYYWYDQRGQQFANEYIMKMSVIWDTLTRQRADGALVRLMAPVAKGNDVAATDKQLRAMARKIRTVLPKYIPE